MIMNTLSLEDQSCSLFLSICNDVQEVPSLRGKITSIMCSWKKKHWNYLLSKGRISPILELKACQKKNIFLIFSFSFPHLLFNCVKFAVCNFLRLLLLSDSHWIITLYSWRLTFNGMSTLQAKGRTRCTPTLLQVKSSEWATEKERARWNAC